MNSHEQFGSDCADRNPVCGQLLRNGLCIVGVRGVEQKGHAVAILGMDTSICVAILECPSLN